MKKINLTFMMFAIIIAALSFSACSRDDDDTVGFKQDYDRLQINGVEYACYGYRCIVTYTSSWDFSENCGQILLPCGKMSDAEKGEYDYDYMYTIYLESPQGLKKGSKLENFSPVIESNEDWFTQLDYVSGSAIITDKKDDEYITVKFDSFKFENGSKSYTLNGTVQLDLDED